MISDDDIDVLPNDEAAQRVDIKPEDGKIRPRKSIGFKSLLAGMIIAALGGAAGGTVLNQLTSPAPLPAAKPDFTVVNSSLDALARDNKALKSQLSKLQKQSASAAAPVDLTPLLSRIQALEEAAQNAPAPVIDEALIARLETLQKEGSPALDLSDITQRLTALESAGPNEKTREILQDLYESQGALFVQVEDALDNAVKTVLSVEAPAPTPTKETAAPLPDFPEAELRAALEGMNKSEGWAKRTLNKHIAVRGEDDPESLIAGIKLDLEKKDVVAAASKFDSLPPQLRAAAQPWRDALKP